ncbi:hypothetical protein Y032_0157g3220 [Ancylostoma ceylanicum]|uniref:Uncharacterized protein n=1 Tax=Ancylostoma ceylanicum TaxID=53326 RepID=A0A016SZ17_9BILA|nr:hypothetical protein Y032_0157g3220 [Ancylostoma ceylanicum]
MSSSEFNETSFVKEAVKEILEDPSPVRVFQFNFFSFHLVMAPSRKYGCNFRDLEEGNGKKRYELACLFG